MPTQWVEPDDMESMAGTKLPPAIGWLSSRSGSIPSLTVLKTISSSISTKRRPRRHRWWNDCSRISHAIVAHEIEFENSIGVKGVVMGVNYGIDKLRFLAPVRAGKRIRAHTEVLNVDRKDANRFLVKTGVTVEIEGEKPQRSMLSGWECSSSLNRERLRVRKRE